MSAIASINHGANEIARGNYDAAIEILLESLRTLRSSLTAPREFGNAESSLKSLDEENMDIDFIHSKGPSSLRFPVIASGDQSRIPIFHEPFVVRSAQGRSISRMQAVACSYVAMYNLALAYHLRYDAAMEPDASDLAKAVSLYECAHSVLIKEKVGFSSVHLLVLINNVGSVHRSLGDEEKARLCLEHELVIFMYLVDSGGIQDLGNCLDGFVNSVLPHMIEKSHYAAAA